MVGRVLSQGAAGFGGFPPEALQSDDRGAAWVHAGSAAMLRVLCVARVLARTCARPFSTISAKVLHRRPFSGLVSRVASATSQECEC